MAFAGLVWVIGAGAFNQGIYHAEFRRVQIE
jgi:hypothetical protein